MPARGVTLRRIPKGAFGAGIPVVRLHYTANPNLTAERIEELRRTYTNPALWARELEIEYEALEGARLYPEYIPERNDCEPVDVSDPAQWTIWMACDPHMRTPHAFAWEAFNKEGDSVLCGELWTKEKYWGCKEWADTIHWLESDSREKPYAWEWAQGRKLHVFKRIMDTHGAAANSEEGADFFKTYAEYDLAFQRALKGQQILAATRDKIDRLFTPQPAYNSDGSMFMQPRRHIFNTCKEARSEYLNVRYPEGEVERPSQEKPKSYVDHIIDCCNYIYSAGGRFVQLDDRQGSLWKPLYDNIAY